MDPDKSIRLLDLGRSLFVRLKRQPDNVTLAQAISCFSQFVISTSIPPHCGCPPMGSIYSQLCPSGCSKPITLIDLAPGGSRIPATVIQRRGV